MTRTAPHRVRRTRRPATRRLVAVVMVVVLAGCSPPEDTASDAPRRSAAPDNLAPADQGPWDPPALEDPETVTLDSTDTHARLERGKDYVVELAEPISAVGGVIISGGRNVVLVGGHITIPWAGPDASAADRRGLFVRWQSGTVHVEGLLIDNEGGDLSEGIQINAPNARVQLVNIRVDGVHARDPVGFSDNHPDVVQPWGGARELWISGLTGVSGYQGIFLKADQNELGRVVLHRVNLVGDEDSRYLLWATADVEVEMSEVWVRPAPGRRFTITVRPEPPDPTWAPVRQGRPPGGDFVPADAVGHDYQERAAA